MSFQRTFARDLVVVAAYRYSASALAFLASLVIARLITPREYGVVAMINVFGGFVMTFLDTGISAAGIRSAFSPSFHRQLQTLALSVGLGLCLVMMALAWPLSWIYGSPALLWPSLVTGVTILAAAVPVVPNAVLSKELRFREIGMGGLVRTVANGLLTIGFALLGFSYWSLILPLTISPLVQRLYLESRVPLGFRLVSWPELGDAFRKTRGLLGSLGSFAFFNYWARTADKFMAGKYYGETAAGILTRAYSLLILPLGMITGVYTTVQMPSFQRLKDKGADMEPEYLLSLRALNVLAFPLAAIMILFPHRLATLLWGSRWEAVGAFLPVFGAVLLLQCMASTSGALFVVCGREREFASIGVVNAILMTGAIIVGGCYSLQIMVAMYALVFTVLCVPILVYYGYIGVLGFRPWSMAAIWAVDTAGCALLTVAHMVGSGTLTRGVLMALFLHKLWTTAGLFEEYRKRTSA